MLKLARSHGIKGRRPELAVARALEHEAGEAFLEELAARVAVGLATMVAVLDPGRNTERFAAERGITAWHLSLTHTETTAMAVAIATND